MDNKTIIEKINSLHSKILSDKFAEKVYESEMLALIEAVHILENNGIVKHGKWISGTDTSPCMPETDVCSECGYRTVYGYNYKYCPNCGAKLDLE